MTVRDPAKVHRALARLDEEVCSDEEILDLLDNFESLASSLAVYWLPPKVSKKRRPIEEVLRLIAKDVGDSELKKLAKELGGDIHALRRDTYGDDDDSQDMVEFAESIRFRVMTVVKRWVDGVHEAV